jgi:hypothetical protein
MRFEDKGFVEVPHADNLNLTTALLAEVGWTDSQLVAVHRQNYRWRPKRG